MARRRFIDIGANLVDEMYQGIYNCSKKHEVDLDKVIQRSRNVNVEHIFITAGNYDESIKAIELVKNLDPDGKFLHATLGVHPTRCSEFINKIEGPDQYIRNLKEIFTENKDKIIALGEFGLDYERTQFCDIETQKKYFELQLTELGPFTKLPLFLHCRAAAKDLHEILSNNKNCFSHGVVHSFDGTVEEMKSFIDLGLHIGINGCSLKTEENCKMAKEIPVESLMIETDSPWCGIRPSHYSAQFVKTKFECSKKNWSPDLMYKQRNEPQTILNVLEVLAALKDIDPESLSQTIFQNTENVFLKINNF